MASSEQAFPSTAVEIGGGRVITTPFQFVADADTFLRVVSVCSVAGVTLAVQGRRLDEHGQIQPIQETHAPNSNRTTRRQDYNAGVGAILNLTVFASAGAPGIGQCYVLVQLLRNTGGTALVLGTLLGGYVTATQALGFPGSPVQSSLEGPGAIRAVVGTNPAPTTEWAETVPTGARWRLQHLLAQLATTAVVASRIPYLVLNFLGTNFTFYPPAGSIPASFSQYVQWATGYTTWVVGGVTAQAASIPSNIQLPSGASIASFTENLQAGDDWAAPEIIAEEWLEVNS